MGHISIACYKPKPGQETALEKVVKDHLPILRRLQFATDRESIAGRAKDGTIVEVFEWASEDAIAQAHDNPEVLAMWEAFGACCDCVPFGSLPEAQDMFAGLTPL